MKLAAFINIPSNEFWEMTPYELILRSEVYKERIIEDIKERVTLAYMNAKWTIQWLEKPHKQPKPLQYILNKIEVEREKKVMTDDEIFAQIKRLNAMFGGEVK